MSVVFLNNIRSKSAITKIKNRPKTSNELTLTKGQWGKFRSGNEYLPILSPPSAGFGKNKKTLKDHGLVIQSNNCVIKFLSLTEKLRNAISDSLAFTTEDSQTRDNLFICVVPTVWYSNVVFCYIQAISYNCRTGL